MMEIKRKIDLDFIKRCEEFARPMVDENREIIRTRNDKWNNENRELCRKLNQIYVRTEKGKKAVIRRNCIRLKRYREACKSLSKEEIDNIKFFYLNCPIGYEVDHIIPISKGGKHHISNFQYLTKLENRKKKDKIINIQ